MDKQHTLKSIGMFFIFITISAAVASAETASGQSKNNSSTIDNKTKKGEEITVYARGTSYQDTETSSGLSIKTVESIGLVPVAVDPEIIPLGSEIIGQNFHGVAVDEGPDVISRKAAKELALKQGYSKNSREYKALVFDFHAKSDITDHWEDFKVIVYKGKSFRYSMSPTEQIAYLKKIKKGG